MAMTAPSDNSDPQHLARLPKVPALALS